MGLPGAGKSTITVPFIENLKEHGVKSENYTEYHAHFMSQTSSKIGFVLFIILHLQKCSALFRLLYLKTSEKKILLNRIFRLFILIYTTKQYLRKKDNTTLIFDQGIIQMIISILILVNVEPVEISRVFKEARGLIGIEKREYAVVLVDIDIDSSIKRIKLRDKPTCEFKDMTVGKLENVLEEYQRFLGTSLTDMVISSQNTPINENVALLLEELSCHK